MTDCLPSLPPVSASPALLLPAPSTRWFRQYYLLALLVLVVGLAVTYQLWRSSERFQLNEMQERFDFSVRDAGTRIEQRMAAYEQVLHSVEGFMSHANFMNRDEFGHFVKKLRLDENYPGIQAVSFAQIVPAAQKARHIAAIRREGFPAYAIHPDGERELYTPVIYIEPFSGRNLRVFGYDTYSQPARRTAMEQARDFDLPVITGKVMLVQENGKNAQAGFLMYQPVFQFGALHRSIAERRASIIGWVAAAFRMNDLMDGLHGEQAAKLDIEIFDGDDMSASNLMYDPDYDHVDGMSGPGLFQTIERFRIANHTWSMKVRSRPAFDAQLNRDSPHIVAASGVGISLLLALLTLVLVNSRERALHAARKMNRELIERETRYRQMFQDNTSIAYLLEPETGRIVDANAAAAVFWGYPLEQLRTMNVADINTAPQGQLIDMWRRAIEGKNNKMEWRHRLSNGTIRDVEIFLSPLVYHGELLLYAILHDISARKQAEQALQESEARMREITATIGEGVLVTDRHGIITFINPEAQRLLGWPESALLGQNSHALLHHTRSDGTPCTVQECDIRRAVDSGQPFRLEDEAFWRQDGSMLPVAVNATPIIRDQAVIGSVLAFHDITEHKRIEADLRVAATAFEAQVGMIVTDANGVMLKVNRAFTESTGYSTEDAVGQTPRLLKSGRHDAAFYAAMWESIRRTGAWEGEIWDRRKNGEIYPKWITITAVKGNDGIATHYVGAQTDITERKAAEAAIRDLAFYDPLTHLPNRRLLLDRLHQALATSTRNQRQGALLFIDLDNFKTLNDTLGHDHGDLLLQQVAQRLLACVREGDMVARLGGDEFVVMLEDLSPKINEAPAQAKTVGEKISAALNRTYLLNDHEYHSTASIGVTLFGQHHEAIEELLKQADLAMYQAKATGRNALRFFDPAMQAEITARVALEKDLRHAVREGQLILYYQAQVENRDHMTGAEVLVRWQHPQRGMVFPDAFIGLAEETGLIVPLGHWVLESACAQLAAWAAHTSTVHLTLAVNVSVQQLRQPDFVEQVLTILDHTGADPRKLKLEITESLLMDSVEDTIAKMTALKARGVGFALDDFGTGYSSLSYLKRLPLEKLKIDRSFVMDVLTDPNDAAIAKTIVALAQSLGLAVIAEGVETEEQRDFLARNGCHAYQGYLFSRPLPLADFEQFLNRNEHRNELQTTAE